MDENLIIDEIASVLRRPSNRETEQDRYRTLNLIFGAQTWKDPEEVDVGTPLGGGPDPRSGRILVYDDDTKGRALIAKAREGDHDADHTLCDIAARYISLGRALPSNLRDYIETLLQQRANAPRFVEGGNRYQNVTRNFSITQAFKHLRKEYPTLSKTRATHLIRRALEKIGVHISDDGVRQVLKRFPFEHD